MTKIFCSNKNNEKNYNKNVHWLKMLKEHELSAVALQPSTDKNDTIDERKDVCFLNGLRL